MADQTNQPENFNLLPSAQRDADGLVDRDLLVSRLLDGQGKARDWAALRKTVATDPTAWEDLIDSAMNNEALQSVVQGEGQSSWAGLDLEALRARAFDLPPGDRNRSRWGAAGGRERSDWLGQFKARTKHLGWPIAAALAIGLATTLIRQRDVATTMPTNAAGIGAAFFTPEQALANYLDVGKRANRVVGQGPQMVVLETRKLPDGQGEEVLFMRPIIERAIIRDSEMLAGTLLNGNIHKSLENATVPGKDEATKNVPGRQVEPFRDL
jgi:hypothetical protein